MTLCEAVWRGIGALRSLRDDDPRAPLRAGGFGSFKPPVCPIFTPPPNVERSQAAMTLLAHAGYRFEV